MNQPSSVIGIRRTLSDTSGLADTLTIRARRLSN
jgi:hypothetical protein